MYDLKTQYDDESATQGFASRIISMNPIKQWMHRELPANLTNLTILDIGCGAGRWFPYFKERNAKQIIGVEISRAMLTKISNHVIYTKTDLAKIEVLRDQEIILIHGEICEILPEFPLKLDVAFASFVLCVMEDPKVALDTIYSTLLPGGIALICTNVVVHKEFLSTDSHLLQKGTWQKEELLENLTKKPDGSRKNVPIVLHLPGIDLPIIDKAHTLYDYNTALERWDIQKAHLLPLSEYTFIDGTDKNLQKQYHGQVIENAISLIDTTAQLACLCLKIQRK